MPYQALSNLAELPVVGVHAVTGKGYAKHHGHDKLVVQLINRLSYQAGEFLERCKESNLNGCNIFIEKIE